MMKMIIEEEMITDEETKGKTVFRKAEKRNKDLRENLLKTQLMTISKETTIQEYSNKDNENYKYFILLEINKQGLLFETNSIF